MEDVLKFLFYVWNDEWVLNVGRTIGSLAMLLGRANGDPNKKHVLWNMEFVEEYVGVFVKPLL